MIDTLTLCSMILERVIYRLHRSDRLNESDRIPPNVRKSRLNQVQRHSIKKSIADLIMELILEK